MDEELELETGEELSDEDFAAELAELSDEELAEIEEALVADYTAVTTGEDFALGDEDALNASRDIVAAIRLVRAEFAARLAADEESAEVDANDQEVFSGAGEDFLATRRAARNSEFVAKEEAAVEETAAEEVVTASAEIAPDGLEGDKPKDVVKTFNFMTASADVPGFGAGEQLPDMAAVAKALMAKRPHVRGTDKGNDGYRYLVASLQGEYPAERTLTGDYESDKAKIDAVASPSAIVASGGFCAPLTPYYALQTFGDTGRPVRDSLPSFKASRGGIRFMSPPVLGDLVGSVRRTTATQDAAGYTNQTPPGTTDPKPCLHVTCGDESTSIVEAVSRCLTFGNLGARTYPEQVEAWLKLVMVEFSRYCEIEVLDQISANSVAVTAAQWGSATASLLEQVTLAVTAFKQRNRVMNGVTMKALMPVWAKEFIRTDLSHMPPYEGVNLFSITDAMIAGWFRERGIEVTFYQDHTTAAGAPFAAQTAGALVDWPNTIQWFLYPEGAFLYLDGGSLDLGLVRDSTLNSQNDYQIWSEEFFGVTFLGTEAYKVTSTLCPDGSYGGKVDTDTKPGCP